MGGSAGNSNAQLFQLMSQYGGGGGGGGPSPKDMLSASFADWRKSNPNGSSSVWAPWGLLDSKGIGGDGGRRGGKEDQTTTPPPATEAETFAWQFPQYTQTWAFTPPTPTPYMYPQPFDTKIFGDPLPKKDVKKNR